MRTRAVLLMVAAAAAAAGCHRGEPAAPAEPTPAAIPGGMGMGEHMPMRGRGMGGGGMHRMHAMRHAMHHGARGSADSAAPSPPAAAIPVCPALTRTLVDEGRAVFARRGNCTACHGADARGTPIAPDLSDAAWLHADGTYFSIAGVVAAGVARPMRYPAIMPARGGADLAPMEVCAVAAYVHSLSADDGDHSHDER